MTLPHWSLRRPLRRPIAAALYLVLFGLIRQLSLLREEFRLSKFTLHSDLRRRAVSRRTLPRTSSHCYYCDSHLLLCFRPSLLYVIHLFSILLPVYINKLSVRNGVKCGQNFPAIFFL